MNCLRVYFCLATFRLSLWECFMVRCFAVSFVQLLIWIVDCDTLPRNLSVLALYEGSSCVYIKPPVISSDAIRFTWVQKYIKSNKKIKKQENSSKMLRKSQTHWRRQKSKTVEIILAIKTRLKTQFRTSQCVIIINSDFGNTLKS